LIAKHRRLRGGDKAKKRHPMKSERKGGAWEEKTMESDSFQSENRQRGKATQWGKKKYPRKITKRLRREKGSSGKKGREQCDHGGCKKTLYS